MATKRHEADLDLSVTNPAALGRPLEAPLGHLTVVRLVNLLTSRSLMIFLITGGTILGWFFVSGVGGGGCRPPGSGSSFGLAEAAGLDATSFENAEDTTTECGKN